MCRPCPYLPRYGHLYQPLLWLIVYLQKARGSDYIIGQAVTAADFYWAAFSNFVVLQSPEDILLDLSIRPMFENTPAEVTAAVDPILLEYRDRIMHTCFKMPLEL